MRTSWSIFNNFFSFDPYFRNYKDHYDLKDATFFVIEAGLCFEINVVNITQVTLYLLFGQDSIIPSI